MQTKQSNFLPHGQQLNRTFELRRFPLVPLTPGSMEIGGTVPDTITPVHAIWEDSTYHRPYLWQLCNREIEQRSMTRLCPKAVG